MSYQEKESSFFYLLYLYIWPFWMFVDVNKPSLFERAAAWRHNKSKLIYMPGYMIKWTILSFFLMSMIYLFDHSNNICMTLISASCGVLFALSFIILLHILIVYIFINKWNHN